MTEVNVQPDFSRHPATLNRITELAAGIFQINASDIRPEMGPDDIDQWDSLNHLRLITEIEDAFSIRLTMQQIQQIKSLQDIAALMSEGAG